MEELLEKIVRPLLLNKDELIIREVVKNSHKQENSRGGARSFDLIVSPDDMGRVIGSKGNIIKSIRTIVKAMAETPGERITINVKEPENAVEGEEGEAPEGYSFSSDDTEF